MEPSYDTKLLHYKFQSFISNKIFFAFQDKWQKLYFLLFINNIETKLILKTSHFRSVPIKGSYIATNTLLLTDRVKPFGAVRPGSSHWSQLDHFVV